MTRREMLMAAASAPGLLLSPLGAASAVPNPHGRRGIGATPTGYMARMRANREAKPPVDWIDYCHGLGLGGAETAAPPTDPEGIRNYRDKVESYDMHVIFNVRLPNTEADVPAFEIGVKSAKEIGAYGLHAALTPRRYEQFDSFEAFKASFEKNQRTVALAEPVLRKYKIRLAIENHKGWRSAEQAAWLKRLSSEYVGVHFDFGNNVSLCEDPMQTLDNLLPYVTGGHIKDMSVAPYPDGFLLSEVVLGDGFLDLKTMVRKLREKDPNMALDLETITRDPLKIPVFTDKYWVTFDDSYSPLPGRDLARTLELVQKNPPKKPLPKTSGLSPAEQLKNEDENNLASVLYARQNLGL
jgi:3-oxoisoapionate decarboxylase